MTLNRWLLLPLILTSCTAPVTPALRANPALQAPHSVQTFAQTDPLQSRGIVKAEYTYSADQTELTITMERDDGQTQENHLVRQPLGGSAVSVETVLKRNGAVTSRHRTLVDEAQLALKVAANNGWQSVYHDLKERYQLAGLL